MLCGIYLGVRTSTSKGQLKVVYYEIHDLALFCNSTLYTKNYKASVLLQTQAKELRGLCHQGCFKPSLMHPWYHQTLPS